MACFSIPDSFPPPGKLDYPTYISSNLQQVESDEEWAFLVRYSLRSYFRSNCQPMTIYRKDALPLKETSLRVKEVVETWNTYLDLEEELDLCPNLIIQYEANTNLFLVMIEPNDNEGALDYTTWLVKESDFQDLLLFERSGYVVEF